MRPIIGYYDYWVVLTYLSAVSAIFGVCFAFDGNIKYALVCLMISGLCDTLDGRVARLKKRNDRELNYGIQIDALADLVSFGVLPAAIGYSVMQSLDNFGTLHIVILSLYVLAALIRLAYFNVIEAELQGRKQKRKYYVGMPVTIVSLIIPFAYTVCYLFEAAFPTVYNVLLVIITVAFVLKVKIPAPSNRVKFILCLIGLPVIIYIIWYMI